MTAVVSRAEARALGRTRYFTGRPCKYGHVAARAVVSKHCVDCGRARRAADPEKYRARARAYRAASPEKFRDRGRKRARAQYAADPEKQRERARAQYAADPEKCRARRRAARAADPEKHREYARAWRAANPKKQRECARAHYWADPEKARARARAQQPRVNQRRKERRAAGDPVVTLRKAVTRVRHRLTLRIAKGKLKRLGYSAREWRDHLATTLPPGVDVAVALSANSGWSLDHVVPLSAIAKLDLPSETKFRVATDLDNQRLLRLEDNVRRGTGDEKEWRPLLERLVARHV